MNCYFEKQNYQLQVLSSNDCLEEDQSLAPRLVGRRHQEVLQLHPQELNSVLLQSAFPINHLSWVGIVSSEMIISNFQVPSSKF